MSRAAAALTAAVAFAAAAPPAAAVDIPPLGLFRKRPKPEATNKAKQALTTLQSDPDEKKRVQAADELRGYDPRQNPDVIPGLITALQKDPSTDVRSMAVASIGQIRPSQPTAAVAMEHALQTEPDPKVREAIKGALFQYHLNGYRSPPASPSLAARQTAEPPLATQRIDPPAADLTFRPITNSVGKGVYYPPTAEPPLAKTKPTTAPAGPTPMRSAPPSVAPTVTPPPSVTIPAPPTVPSIPVPAPLPGGVPSTSLPAGTPTTIPLPAVPTIPLPPSQPKF